MAHQGVHTKEWSHGQRRFIASCSLLQPCVLMQTRLRHEKLELLLCGLPHLDY
jgi:hypothetical protein